MEHHELDWNALLWAGGWLGAVLVLFAAGLRLPLQAGLAGWRGRAYSAGAMDTRRGLDNSTMVSASTMNPAPT